MQTSNSYSSLLIYTLSLILRDTVKIDNLFGSPIWFYIYLLFLLVGFFFTQKGKSRLLWSSCVCARACMFVCGPNFNF